MIVRKVLILIFLTVTILPGNAQKKDFKTDTTVGKYLVRIKVYETKMDKDNIKAYFSFYDSTVTGKLRFIYYFKFLPSKEENQPGIYVPIFQDWNNINNSRYLWKDISKANFDYNKSKKYVLLQFENNNEHSYISTFIDTINLKLRAKNQFLSAFNALIKKDYLTFAKSVHPAELKQLSYQAKADEFAATYKSTDFHFTTTRVDSVGALRNYFGEIQVILFTTQTYEDKNKTGSVKQFIVARSFDDGVNWYFKEITRQNRNFYFEMSKGNLNEAAIDWELIKNIEFK